MTRRKKTFAKLEIVLCAVLLICSIPFAVLAEEAETTQTIEEQVTEMLAKDRVPGELLVRFYGNVSNQNAWEILYSLTDDSAFIEQISEKTDKFPNWPESFKITTTDEKLSVLLAAFNTHEDIIVAIPNFRHEIQLPASCESVIQSSIQITAPNVNITAFGDEALATYDPTAQWQLDTIGVKNAWDCSFIGSENIKIGVLDTGIDTDHPEFDNNIDWSLAYNAVTQSVGKNHVEDTHGHGTLVTGIIAADLDETGISGICPNVTVVPIKIGNGMFDQTPVDNAISYAAQNDIQILNICYAIDRKEYTYLQYALSQYDGILVVAAGNMGMDMINDPLSSGKIHDDENWFIVGAVGINNMKYSTSNYSELYCDIFAPGEGIETTVIGGGYDTFSETSVAAPHVTAAIALIASKATHMSMIEIKELLMDEAIPSVSLTDKCVCDGRLSIINAVNRLFGENRGAYSLGDVTGDGYITTEDVTVTRQFVIGTATPTNDQTTAADVNNDSDITAKDYMMIQRFALGTFYFPPE